MTEQNTKTDQVENLLATPDLAGVLEREQFKRFLDQVPIAIGVSEIKVPERIVYTNPEFEKVTGQLVTAFLGKPWTVLSGYDDKKRDARTLGEALAESGDFVGTYIIERAGSEPACVDAYSNVIEDDNGTPCYRFAALIEVGAHKLEQNEFEQKLREKDTLLREVQHRVKNNLQMITALMRLEARNARGKIDTAPFDRLAGRIEAIKLLYGLLSDE